MPVAEESYQQTLAKPADLTDWEERPDSFPEMARVWGVRTDREQGPWERNRRNLERKERGDQLLIYGNSESRHTASGRVGPMTHTEYIRDEFGDGGPALDVFVVEDYDDSLDAAPERINEMLGYEESFWPQGLWRVSNDRPTARVVREFGI